MLSLPAVTFTFGPYIFTSGGNSDDSEETINFPWGICKACSIHRPLIAQFSSVNLNYHPSTALHPAKIAYIILYTPKLFNVTVCNIVHAYFYRAALNAGRSSQEKAVCLSVRLSNALWLNGRKICPDFYTILKII